METAWLGGGIDALKEVVMKVKGDKDKIKGLVEMMTREMMVLFRRWDNLWREGGRKRAEIAGLRFLLEEAETRCSCLTNEAEVVEV